MNPSRAVCREVIRSDNLRVSGFTHIGAGEVAGRRRWFPLIPSRGLADTRGGRGLPHSRGHSSPGSVDMARSGGRGCDTATPGRQRTARSQGAGPKWCSAPESIPSRPRDSLRQASPPTSWADPRRPSPVGRDCAEMSTRRANPGGGRGLAARGGTGPAAEQPRRPRRRRAPVILGPLPTGPLPSLRGGTGNLEGPSQRWSSAGAPPEVGIPHRRRSSGSRRRFPLLQVPAQRPPDVIPDRGVQASLPEPG